MNSIIPVEPFFAPSVDGALDHLISRRDAIKTRIEDIAEFIDGEARAALGFCLDAVRVKNRDRGGVPTADELLDVPRAVSALDAHFWAEAMRMTDVYECMPKARRDEWSEQIHDHKTPAFTADNVVPTFEFLLSARSKFFAERVDGIFRALSHKHVTNQPEGFGKRMIMPNAVSEFGRHPESGMISTIHDLRCVIARFMGRDEPKWADSSGAIRLAAKRAGEWTTIDGGALRLRVYTGVRTAHLEVHPDMAWRLNGVLASLYPTAIPSQFREPPKRRLREFKLMMRPLPFAVIGLLRELVPEPVLAEDGFGRRKLAGVDTRRLRLSMLEKPDKATKRQLDEVLEAIGGVRDCDVWQFSYAPHEVIDEIICSGCIPDAMSHQFYPTPDEIVTHAVAAADLRPGLEVLEPSAGTGNIANALRAAGCVPACVEVSELHCSVLRACGHDVVHADFIQWAQAAAQFDRIVMNPPYSEGRWQAHVEAAAALLAPGGRLVAVLPVSARGKAIVPGLRHSWGRIYEGAFKGASITTTLLTLDKPARGSVP